MTKPIVVLSSCLNFENVRYNGQVVPSKIVADLEPFVEYQRACPETGIGLGVPREPIRIVKIGTEYRLIQHVTNRDVTDEMNKFTKDFIANLGDVDGFIFKSRSPTMGLKGIKVYSDIKKGAPVVERCSGFFAGAVAQKYFGFPIEDEGRLLNKRIREHFLTRLFLFANYRTANSQGELKTFQENYEMLFSFYNFELARELDYSKENYFENIKNIVNNPPSSAQVTVFFNSFRNEVIRKIEYAQMLEEYRQNKLSLETIKQGLRLLIKDKGKAESSFFYPYPMELKIEAQEDRDRNYW